MAIMKKKPRNSSLRFQSFLSNSDITAVRPKRSLVMGLSKSGGRNAYGRITMRHHGGGAARKYRIIDFKRVVKDVPGRVATVEYDPNRNVRIGLVKYRNGAQHYNLLAEGVAVGSEIVASAAAEARVGNSLPLRNIPVGFTVFSVEIRPGSGGVFARSAGGAVQYVAKTDDGYATLRMPSGEVRMVPLDSWATIGVLGNGEYRNISWGKAGRTRHRGIRPSVRGMAMNPVDHKHGGGEGRSKSNKHPVTPWGKGCKGTVTRVRKNRLILKRRKSHR